MGETKINHGVFISYRHNYDHGLLAGRIYDFLKAKGVNPFLDCYSMPQGNFYEEIKEQIIKSPYYLLVLTPGCLNSLKKNNVLYMEIEQALACKENKEIIVIASADFKMPRHLPKRIREIKNRHFSVVNMDSFNVKMEEIYQRLDLKKFNGVIDWKEYSKSLGHTYLNSRDNIEKRVATYDNCYGKDFINCIDCGTNFTGEKRIKSIKMLCYAANVVFNEDFKVINYNYDSYNKMFRIFSELLKDELFSLELIIAAPDSECMRDAIKNKKTGNRKLEDNPERTFYSAYANISNLIKNDEVFSKAYEDKRFNFMVTEEPMIGAIFEMQYKEKWEQFNYIKFDLYSPNIINNQNRRSVIVFEDDDKDNFDFFENIYNQFRNKEKSNALMKENHQKWLKKWDEIKND